MDLLNTTYNRLERLAMGADQLLTVAVRRWDSWTASRKSFTLGDRQQDVQTGAETDAARDRHTAHVA